MTFSGMTREYLVVVDNWFEVADDLQQPVSSWFGVMEKTADKSPGWSYATGEPEAFHGDADRMYPADAQGGYLVWNVEKLRKYAVTLYAKDAAAAESQHL